MRSFYLCPFYWNLRPSGVSLESQGLEKIPQVPPYRVKVAQNHDARKAVLATLLVLKLSGAIFRPKSSTPSVRFFYLCQLRWKLRPSGVSLQSARLENILQVPANPAKVDQNYDGRKVVSATLLVPKWSGAIFRPRSSTPIVRFFYLCPFHWKLRPSGVRLESAGLGNIPYVPANRAKVAQNHDARNAVSATLSGLKWSGAISRPRSWKPSVRSFYLYPFLCKPRPSGVNLVSPWLQNIPQVPGSRTELGQNHDTRKAVSATLSVLKWSGLIFQPRSSKVIVQKGSLCHISLQTKAIRS